MKLCCITRALPLLSRFTSSFTCLCQPIFVIISTLSIHHCARQIHSVVAYSHWLQQQVSSSQLVTGFSSRSHHHSWLCQCNMIVSFYDVHVYDRFICCHVWCVLLNVALLCSCERGLIMFMWVFIFCAIKLTMIRDLSRPPRRGYNSLVFMQHPLTCIQQRGVTRGV